MKQTTNPVNVRIEWCRKQSAQARTEPEADGWRAEGEGLRDAMMNRDHTNDYSLCHRKIRERYMLGFQDGTALLRATRVERVIHTAITGTPQPVSRMGGNVLMGDDR